MFDPSKHDDLKHSPRLAEIKAAFAAIAAGKPALECQRMAADLAVTLNGIERDMVPDLVRKELKNRGY